MTEKLLKPSNDTPYFGQYGKPFQEKIFQILTHILHSEKVHFMRVFLSVLILILSLQSWTKADDICLLYTSDAADE